MSKELSEIKRLANELSPDEQLRLISYLVQRLRNCDIKRKPRRNVMEFAGVAPNLLGGMDAQEYVNRIRRGEFPELEIEQKGIGETRVIVAESLQGVRRLFLDTAPVIYFVQRHAQYYDLVRVFFDRINEQALIGVTSPITLAECLVQPYRLGQTEPQQDFIELMTGNDNIEFVPIDEPDLAIQAAQIRAGYNLQLPDAFQIAVALTANCEAILTNDITLRRVTELRVLVLDELEVT